MKNFIAFFICGILLVLSGCITGSKQGDNKPINQQTVPFLTIPFKEGKVPLAEVVDVSGLEKSLKQEISSSANNNQSQLSGLINTSISKVAERMTGIESNIDSLVKLTNTITLTNNQSASASAEIKTKLEASLAATAEIKAEMNNILSINNKLETNLTMMNNLKADIGELKSSISGQAGVLNNMTSKVEDIKANAGRDVNMLPQSAVDIMLGIIKAYGALVIGLLLLAAIAVILVYRAGMQREALRSKDSEQELQRVHSLLLQSVSMIPKSEDVEKITKGLERPIGR